MLAMFFSWIRAKVKEAVLAGFADAAAEIGDADEANLNAIEQFRERAKMLPAPKKGK